MTLTPVLSVLIFTLGAAVGSFLNVVILRTKNEESFIAGRSHCPNCHHVLVWWEMIPIISFLFLRGKCRYCQAKLSWQYPLVESVTAIGFVGVAWRFGVTPMIVFAWGVFAAAMLVAIYDLRWSLIPDSFTISLAILGTVTAVLMKTPLIDMLLGLIAGVAFFSLQYFLSGRRWVGSGDILLGGALGLWLGWRMLALGLFLSYMIGALIASGLILTGRAKTSSHLAFGPYLILGSLFVWLWGQQIIDWYFNHALFR